MKKKLANLLGVLFRKFFLTYAFFMRIRNHRKDKILFFTDSRGFLLKNFISYKNGFKNPLVKYLIQDYCVDFKINNYKPTTFLDFVREFNDQDLEKYKHIILILGVVDFSPRNDKDAKFIREHKLSFLPSNISTSSSYLDSLNTYDGSMTDSIINKEIEDYIIKRFALFKNKTILVNTGHVDPDWSGNYWRARPKNMNSFLLRERQFAPKVSDNVVDVSKINPLTYTIDNIHYSITGFKILRDKIKTIIK